MDKEVFVKISGIACPIGGVLVGAYNSNSKELETDEVDLKYFQNPLFKQKAYVTAIADKVTFLVDKINGDKTLPIITNKGYQLESTISKLEDLGYDIQFGSIDTYLLNSLGNQHYEYKIKSGYVADWQIKLNKISKKDLPNKKRNIRKSRYLKKVLTRWVKHDHKRLKLLKATGANLISLKPDDDIDFIRTVMSMSTKRRNKKRRKHKKWLMELTTSGQL